jgi:hypothetical protein
MLTGRRFLSSGVTAGGSPSKTRRAAALLISYSHQVWDASNTPEKMFDPMSEDGALETFRITGDSFDKRKPEGI